MSEKRRKYRRRRASDDEDEGEDQEEKGGGEEHDDVKSKLQETKELQKFRKRPAGVSAVGLAFGKKFTEEEKLAPDPFKLKTGGLVDMKEVDRKDLESSEDDLLQRLQSTFSAETKMKDDETHMMQYIEDEMSKKKVVTEDDDTNSTKYETKVKALYQLPENLKVESKAKKTEEMLSNQMLSGIPEVDLGLEAKFKNIEETERAKQELVVEMGMKKKGKQQSLVPSNVATNFTLHSLRFQKDKSMRPPKKTPKEDSAAASQSQYIPVVGENEPELKMTGGSNAQKRKLDSSQLATDDYFYDKYRKRTKHY